MQPKRTSLDMGTVYLAQKPVESKFELLHFGLEGQQHNDNCSGPGVERVGVIFCILENHFGWCSVSAVVLPVPSVSPLSVSLPCHVSVDRFFKLGDGKSQTERKFRPRQI